MAMGKHFFDFSPAFHTADPDEASDALSRVYLPVTLQPTGPTPLDMHMTAEEFPKLTAGYVAFGTEVVIGGDDIPAYYIEAPLSGVARNAWRDGHMEQTTAGSAAVFTPGMPVDLTWSSDCREICLKVSERHLRTQLEAMLHRPVRKRITFARRLDLSDRASSGWFELVRILAREAGRPGGVLAHQLAVDNLQALLLQGLLSIHPHNYAEELTAGVRCASAAVVKSTIDLIHAQPEKGWTTGDLATATGVSARALQKAFQRGGYPPPMTYLCRLRLSKAHAELANADSSITTVTAVAGRWGFVHLGRFADQYRQMFGQSPSETLRAAQGVADRGEDLEGLA